MRSNFDRNHLVECFSMNIFFHERKSYFKEIIKNLSFKHFLILFLTELQNKEIISDNDVDNAAKDEDDNKTNKLLVLGTGSWVNQDTVSSTFH